MGCIVRQAQRGSGNRECLVIERQRHSIDESCWSALCSSPKLVAGLFQVSILRRDHSPCIRMSRKSSCSSVPARTHALSSVRDASKSICRQSEALCTKDTATYSVDDSSLKVKDTISDHADDASGNRKGSRSRHLYEPVLDHAGGYQCLSVRNHFGQLCDPHRPKPSTRCSRLDLA